MTDSHDGDGSDSDPPPSGSRREERAAGPAAEPDDAAPEAQSDDSSPTAADSDGDEGAPDSGIDESPATGAEDPPASDDASAADGEAASPAPTPESGTHADQSVPAPSEDPIGWFRQTDSEAVIVFKDVASSVGIVLVIGLLLFGISGVWPPLVAIESGSMNPHMQKGDLVFIMQEDRLTPDAAVEGTGIVTYQQGKETGYSTFGSYGDVIVFQPNGQDRTPIIHRAMFYVEEGENWYEKANESHIEADSCEEINACSAPHSGFVTKGDNPQTNQQYDQVNQYQIVKPEWIQGTAEVRIPWLGCIRLEFSGTASCGSLFGMSQSPTVDAGQAIGQSGPDEVVGADEMVGSEEVVGTHEAIEAVDTRSIASTGTPIAAPRAETGAIV
ncbi:signal peptidase, endoplasmic reticulum-type [Natronoarchaeum philippinense]|uniref:Signal peptidase, endoplasmic reticulum-type n=1 Tax=Natronoarchaeum philippinense TaxID=558529 RepID=A0A285P0D5_NATPI|nr:S26 family signal peptidase [Natronoarchaeum philippinense]SNZ14898.1 signal peptidase, endoplasmic reticulum-type [Natronoarchaeum philippinense]